MGYPTKGVKRRRHNRNLALHTRVALGGVQIVAHRLPRLPGSTGQNGKVYSMMFQALSPEGHTSNYHVNPVTLMEKTEAYLLRGLEKW